MIKALIISALLAVNPSTTRTEIGFIRNPQTVETTDGNLWCVEDIDSTIATKAVVVTFSTNGTKMVEDDEILEINPIYQKRR